MELKEGMYVRILGGEIFKIINIRKYKTKENEYYFDKTLDRHEDRACNDNLLYEDELDEIIKASFNIIDLIEEGDYVNGEKVTSCEPVDEKDEERYLGFGDYDYYIHDSKDIKEIVTHEQFERESYKVENI